MTTDPPPTALAPPPEEVSIPSKAIPDIADLIWEDGPSEANTWWLSRTRTGGLQLFVAADSLTSCLLCLARSGSRPNDYDILVVISEREHSDRTASLAAAKHAVAVKIANPLTDLGRSSFGWRLERFARIALNQLPLALAAISLGALLGLAVALFAVSTQLVGWPMLVAGILIGAASGPLLKFLIDRRFKSLLGPWGRFWVATLGASLGALVAAGGLLSLYWS